MRREFSRPLLVVGFFLGLAAAVSWTTRGEPGVRTAAAWTLKVGDETGHTLWAADVVSGDDIILEYTNSIYGAKTWEHFSVRGGAFQLERVSSTSEAVFEYHRLDPPFRLEGDRFTKSVSAPALQALRLRVGESGRPILHVGKRAFPLYAAGVGTSLRVTLDRTTRFP